MSKIILFMSVTLDGVMQAPGRPDEDLRGGFQHGGWAVPYIDPEQGKAVGESLGSIGGILFGRRTYEDFYKAWSFRTDGNPYTHVLNNTQKYVVSTTLKEPLPWKNSTILTGNASQAVAALKIQMEQDMVVLGSGNLIQTLMKHKLIDLFILLIHPLVLGTGQRLFAEGSPFAMLKLIDSKITGTGVVMSTYQPVE